MEIEYTEKGYGLHQALAAAGIQFFQQDGVWTALRDGVESDVIDAQAQAIIDGYTLDTAKAEKCLAVSLYAKKLRDEIVATVSRGELASWSIKRAEAEAYTASGGTATCPMLAQEATARGIALAVLVTKVLNNSARFGGAEAAIGGNDGRHRDAIMALTTFEAVAAYDFSAGWPEA
jgi:hypothetical protein